MSECKTPHSGHGIACSKTPLEMRLKQCGHSRELARHATRTIITVNTPDNIGSNKISNSTKSSSFICRLFSYLSPVRVPARDVLTSLAFIGKAVSASLIKVAVIAPRDEPFVFDSRTVLKRSMRFPKGSSRGAVMATFRQRRIGWLGSQRCVLVPSVQTASAPAYPFLQAGQISPAVKYGHNQNQFVTDEVIDAVRKSFQWHAPHSVIDDPIRCGRNENSVQCLFDLSGEVVTESCLPVFVPPKSLLHLLPSFWQELRRGIHDDSRRLAFTCSQVKVFCGFASYPATRRSSSSF